MSEEIVQILRSNVGINSLELESRVRGNSGVFKRQGIEASIQKEKVRIGGEEFIVRRLFIKTATSGDYSNVGWVLDEDVGRCMICAQQFSVFVSRTHCFACGNLVCGSCRDNEAVVFELDDLPPQKVCNQCFWGQEPVYARHNRLEDSLMEDATRRWAVQDTFDIPSSPSSVSRTINMSAQSLLDSQTPPRSHSSDKKQTTTAPTHKPFGQNHPQDANGYNSDNSDMMTSEEEDRRRLHAETSRGRDSTTIMRKSTDETITHKPTFINDAASSTTTTVPVKTSNGSGSSGVASSRQKSVTFADSVTTSTDKVDTGITYTASRDHLSTNPAPAPAAESIAPVLSTSSTSPSPTGKPFSSAPAKLFACIQDDEPVDADEIEHSNGRSITHNSTQQSPVSPTTSKNTPTTTIPKNTSITPTTTNTATDTIVEPVVSVSGAAVPTQTKSVESKKSVFTQQEPVRRGEEEMSNTSPGQTTRLNTTTESTFPPAASYSTGAASGTTTTTAAASESSILTTTTTIKSPVVVSNTDTSTQNTQAHAPMGATTTTAPSESVTSSSTTPVSSTVTASVSSLPPVEPLPFCCMKTRREADNAKVFVNLLTLPREYVKSGEIILNGKALCLDKTGGDCDTYDVIVDESVPNTMDSTARDEIGCKVLGEINDVFNDSLELSFKTPKIKNNYKGSEVRIYSPTGISSPIGSGSSSGVASSTKDKTIRDIASAPAVVKSKPVVPAIVKGWLRKEGQSFKSWKKRYFVLSEGEIVYYEKPSSSPPFGEKPKGNLTLVGAFLDRGQGYGGDSRTSSAEGARASSLTSGGKRIYIVGGQGGRDLKIEADDEHTAQQWAAAIQEHIDYANQSTVVKR